MRTTLTLLAMLVGCQGAVTDPAGETDLRRQIDPTNPNAGPPELAEQPIRRLSSEQYENTIRDLFGEPLGSELVGLSTFPETVIDSGFKNDADANRVADLHSNLIEDNAAVLAEHLLEGGLATLGPLMPCDVSGAGDIAACLPQFVQEFGLRAFRRPVTEAELAIVQGIFDDVIAEQSPEEALSAVVAYFLQSPALLYRVELVDLTTGLSVMSDYEIATRLSYLFLNSMPDDELFRAAAADELSDLSSIRAQAERLSEDERTLDTLTAFHRDWLRLYQAENLRKSRDEFPEFNAEAQADLASEVGHFIRYVMNETDGTLPTLLTTNTFPVSQPLEFIYGEGSGSSGAGDFQPMEVSDRRGLFTLPSFMAVLAEEAHSNPIVRGAFLQREILCGELPPLPTDIDTAGPLEETSGSATARERLAPLLARGECNGCHSLFQPLGLAFENYDALGRYRSTENGATIDASVQLENFGAADGNYESATEMVAAIADTDTVRSCYARKWFRFAFGRTETSDDRASLEHLEETLVETGGDIRSMMVATTETDAFLFRRVSEENR